MNMLDMVPTFQRHLRQWIKEEDTDSNLAAYLADGVEALSYRWDRPYAIEVVQPKTYLVTPDIAPKDKRPIILVSAIIYKAANVSLASFRDGDFAYDPSRMGGLKELTMLEASELNAVLPPARLASAKVTPLRGFENIYNPESYNWSYVLQSVIYNYY